MERVSHKTHDDFSLVVHRRIAAHLSRHPEDLKIALGNLKRWSKTTSRHALPYFKEWRSIISRGKSAVIKTMVSKTEKAEVLRHCSPFVGILSDNEVNRIRSRFRR